MTNPTNTIPEEEKREPQYGEEYEGSRPGIKTLIGVLLVVGLYFTVSNWSSIVDSVT